MMNPSIGKMPNTLNFTPKQLAVSARSYTHVQVPEGNSTNIGERSRITWRIPCGRANTYLNPCKSFFCFNVKNTTPVPAEYQELNVVSVGGNTIAYNELRFKQLQKVCLDGSGYALINRLSIYSSSNLCEEIGEYGLLANMLMDLQISWSNRITTGSILGTGPLGINDVFSRYWSASCAVRNTKNDLNRPEYCSALQDPSKIEHLNYYAGYNLLSQSRFKNNTTAFPGATPDGNAANWTGYAGSVAGINSFPNPPGNITGSNTDGFNILMGGGIGAGAGDPKAHEANPLFGYTSIGPPQSNRYAPTQSVNSAGEYNAYPDYTQQFNTNIGANNVSLITRLGPEISWGGQQRICLPIISGCIGTNLQKLLPLNALSSDLLVNCQLSSYAESCCLSYVPTLFGWRYEEGVAGLVYKNAQTWDYHQPVLDSSTITNAATVVTMKEVAGRQISPIWTIMNAELHLNYVEISAEAQQEIDRQNGGLYTISSTSYRHYSFTDNNPSSSSLTYQIPARFSSLKSLLQCIRLNKTINDEGAFSLTSRVGNFWDQIQWRLGSLMVPQTPILCPNLNAGQASQTAVYTAGEYQPTIAGVNSQKAGSEVFAHLASAFGMGLCDLDLQCSIDDRIFGNNGIDVYRGGGEDDNEVDDGTFAIAKCKGSECGFMFGIDLESFSSQNAENLNSGANTLGLSIFCELKKTNNRCLNGEVCPNPQPATYDSFAIFDQVISISNGVMSVRF